MRKFLFNFFKYGSLIAFLGATAFLIFEAAMPAKQSSNHSNQVGDAISGTLDSIKGDNTKFTAVSEISLNNEFNSNMDYSIGDTLNLSVNILPNNASNKSLTYKSDNPEIINVNQNGVISFIDEGSATITITSNSNKDIQTSVTLNSNHVYPNSIEVEDIEEITVNSTYSLHINLYPNNTTKTKLQYHSSDEDIAVVDEYGKIHAKKAGNITITITTENNIKKDINLTIVNKKDIIIENIISVDEINLYINETAKLDYEIYPSDTTNPSMIFEMENQEIATIENKILTGINPGSTYLTIINKKTPNVKKQILINVLNLPNVENFEIDNNIDLTLTERYKIQLNNITPHNADITNIDFSNYDNNLIDIENNVIIAKSVGETSITVKIGNCEKTINITINNNDIIVLESIELQNNPSSIYVNESYNLEVILNPLNATFNSLIFTSSDENVLHVNENGLLTGKKQGSAIVTIYSNNYPDLKQEFKIYVENVLAKEIELNLDDDLYLGDTYQIQPTLISNSKLPVTLDAISYTSSNPDILYIDETGFISIKDLGEAQITATLVNQPNIKFEKTFKIKERLVEDIIVDSTLKLNVNDKTSLNYQIYPNNAYNQELIFTSNNSDIVSIDTLGNMFAKNNGTCLIYIKSSSNPNIEKIISISVKDVFPTSIIISSDFGTKTKEMTAGESKQLNIKLNDEATFKKITFSSSNQKLAEVSDNGLIIAKYAGTVIITAIVDDGENQIQTNFELTIKRQPAITNNQSFAYLVRKGIGHFGAFLCLALACTVMLICFLQYHPAALTLSSVLGFLIAGLTELIQLVTPGRSGNWTDVGIDYFGYFCGIILIYIIIIGIKFTKWFIHTKKKEKEFNPYDLHNDMFNRKIK